MNPKIKKFAFHSGAPEWSDDPHRPAYRITGTGFGDKLGKVQIEHNGEMISACVLSWSDTRIFIDNTTPVGGCAEVTVTRYNRQRSRRFEFVAPWSEPVRLAA